MEVSKINNAFPSYRKVTPEEGVKNERGGRQTTPLQESKKTFPTTPIKENNVIQKNSGFEKEIQEAIAKLNNTAKLLNTKVRFLYDPKKELVIIQVVEKGGELNGKEKIIRQIPSEEMIKLAESLKGLSEEMLKKGLFLNQEI